MNRGTEWGYLGKAHSRWQEQQTQRPWSRSGLACLRKSMEASVGRAEQTRFSVQEVRAERTAAQMVHNFVGN